MASINRALLDVRDLSVAFGRGTMIAADRVSFRIGKGETVALVGESGSGKTVSALSILRCCRTRPLRILPAKCGSRATIS